MSPRYHFRIDEIGEHPSAPVVVNSKGHWEPSTVAGANIRLAGGVSGIYWYCDGRQILRNADGQLPQGASYYSAFSMYYCAGYGFWVLKGDATIATDAPWRPLQFEHDGQNFSSYLTNAGTSQTLYCQRPDQQWPRMLLPDIYQVPPTPTSTLYGGLKGDLAILLALIAFSMSRENLPRYLSNMFIETQWQVHSLPHGRVHQRGVVVYVYTCPPDTTPNELNLYENGVYMNYYN